MQESRLFLKCTSNAQRYFWLYTKFQCFDGEFLVDGVKHKVVPKFYSVLSTIWDCYFNLLCDVKVERIDLHEGERLYYEKPNKNLGPTWSNETYSDTAFQVVYLSHRFGRHLTEVLNTLSALMCQGYITRTSVPDKWFINGSGPMIEYYAIKEFCNFLGLDPEIKTFDPNKWFSFKSIDDITACDQDKVVLFTSHVLRDHCKSLSWTGLFVSVEDTNYVHDLHYVNLYGVSGARVYGNARVSHEMYKYKPIVNSTNVDISDIRDRVMSAGAMISEGCDRSRFDVDDFRVRVAGDYYSDSNDIFPYKFSVLFEDDFVCRHSPEEGDINLVVTSQYGTLKFILDCYGANLPLDIVKSFDSFVGLLDDIGRDDLILKLEKNENKIETVMKVIAGNIAKMASARPYSTQRLLTIIGKRIEDNCIARVYDYVDVKCLFQSNECVDKKILCKFLRRAADVT